MRQKILILVSSLVVLAAGLGAYAVVARMPGTAQPTLARSVSMPAEPYVLYLAPVGASRGLVNHELMAGRGATSVHDWQSARSASQNQPLDALLVDASLLDSASGRDVAWLQSQFHDGVVVVGMGVDDDEFARQLGLETFRVPGEAVVPLGPTGYRMASSLVLGDPEDIANQGNWIDRLIRGEGGEETIPVQHRMIGTFGSARGEVNSEADVDLLFVRLYNKIAGIYDTRAEYQADLARETE